MIWVKCLISPNHFRKGCSHGDMMGSSGDNLYITGLYHGKKVWYSKGWYWKNKSKTLEEKYQFSGKTIWGSPGPLVPWSSGPLPLVLWSLGPLVPWSPGPWVLLIPCSLTLLILVLYPSHPLISQIHPNQPEIDPKTNSRQYVANNTKCCR